MLLLCRRAFAGCGSFRVPSARWTSTAIQGLPLVPGRASGAIISTDVGLSFWGGVDAKSGVVIDSRHPLHGHSLAGKILVIPNGRGSCTGSQVILELLLAGCAPAAIVLLHTDEIISLGSIVGEELFGCSLPIVTVCEGAFLRASRSAYAHVGPDGTVLLTDTDAVVDASQLGAKANVSADENALVVLSAEDRAMASGDCGTAAQVAMRILVRMAKLQGASELISVSQVHVDSTIYVGPASLSFVEQLVRAGGRVRVPTTLNAISVDQRRWHDLGVAASLGVPASAVGDAYVALGATPSFTCAPYLLESAPMAGEDVAWGESNAVVFANSCLGARTQKYADLLDVCIALTGRAPLAGPHVESARVPRVVVAFGKAVHLDRLDDCFWPIAGYLCGLEAATEVWTHKTFEHESDAPRLPLPVPVHPCTSLPTRTGPDRKSVV